MVGGGDVSVGVGVAFVREKEALPVDVSFRDGDDGREAVLLHFFFDFPVAIGVEFVAEHPAESPLLPW